MNGALLPNATADAASAEATCWVSNQNMGTYGMKTLAIGAALATLFASSAFAQSYNPAYGTGNVTSPAAEASGGKDMAFPSYPDGTVQPAASEHLNGIRAEAPKAKRRHATPASQQ